MEEKGKPEAANKLFLQTQNEATSDFEKFISAHSVAQHQKNVSNLSWNESRFSGWRFADSRRQF